MSRCLLCKIAVVGKDGRQVYDNECTRRFLCVDCGKLWDKHTEDKVDKVCVYEGSIDFDNYVKYLKKFLFVGNSVAGGGA